MHQPQSTLLYLLLLTSSFLNLTSLNLRQALYQQPAYLLTRLFRLSFSVTNAAQYCYAYFYLGPKASMRIVVPPFLVFKGGLLPTNSV